MTITSRMPRADYDAIDALNISRLKEMKRSPQHYRHALTHRKETAPLITGNACHVAVLEPERYELDFCVWDRVTDGGAMAPRRGQFWDAFLKGCGGRTVLTPEQSRLAGNIAAAVRGNELAAPYLANGDPEVTLQWTLDEALGARPARGRVDWITIMDGKPIIVGLKTARDCRHFVFAKQAANLGYHLQWAYYFDGFKTVRGVEPRMIEIVVEVAPPHAVAVYRIPTDIIEQGRDEYWECVKKLAECEALDVWPGPVAAEEDLTLPSWCYQQEEDVTDLGLE
jgi:hypothetical protein